MRRTTLSLWIPQCHTHRRFLLVVAPADVLGHLRAVSSHLHRVEDFALFLADLAGIQVFLNAVFSELPAAQAARDQLHPLATGVVLLSPLDVEAYVRAGNWRLVSLGTGIRS